MVAPADSATLFRRIINPERGSMSPELARFVRELDFPPADHARFDELSAAAQERQLTEDESAELQNYLHVDNVLAIFRLKAERSLASNTSSR